MTLSLDAIGLTVHDMAASLAFYRRLGLDIPATADSEHHVEVQLAGGTRLMFDTEDVVASFDTDFVAPDPAERGRVSFAVRAGNPAEVDRTYAALSDAGHPGHLPPFDAVWGQRYASVRDPDGVLVDLYASLAG